MRHSPRSTRGTIRTIAYWNWLRGLAGTFGLLHESMARRQAPREVADIRSPLPVGAAGERIVGQPQVGDRGRKLGEQPFAEAC